MKFSKTKIILVSIFGLILLARVLAPPIILKKTNDYLATFSETYYAHVEDFDLSLFRSAYRFEKVQITPKQHHDKKLITAEMIDVSIAWGELFKGRVVTNVVATDVNLVADNAVTETAKTKAKQSVEEAKDARKALFPIETEMIEIRNARLEYREFKIFIDQIDGRLSHVTATPENPLSILTMRGFLFGKGALKAIMTMNTTQEPTAWVVAAELQKMNLVETNFFTSQFIPLTFQKGILDVYAEVKSEKGRMTGYVKPFLKDGDVIGDQKDFKSLKHFGIEITTAAVNALFKSNKSKTVATKILFSRENGKFDWNMSEAITQLFKNGYQEELNPGLENLLSLSQKTYSERKN